MTEGTGDQTNLLDVNDCYKLLITDARRVLSKVESATNFEQFVLYLVFDLNCSTFKNV